MTTEAVIIEVAVNGPTSKRRNPHVPISIEEIAQEALELLAAGASIVHQHDADGATSAERTAEQSLATYERVLGERPDALLYPTATFLDPMTERWGHHELLAKAGVIRMAFVDPGSVNLGRTAIGNRKPPSAFVYSNSLADVDYKFERCRELGLGPSMAIFEPGFLRVALEYAQAGRMPAGSLTKFYFGGGGAFLFGLPPREAALDLYHSLIEDSGLPWAAAVLGGDCVESGMAGWAVERGGHIRVGLEDYAGEETPTNLELLARATQVVETAGKRVATPAETAEILGLP